MLPETPPERLLPGTVHVWHCDVDAGQDSAAIDRCLALLDDTELARLARFRFPVHRRRFAVSHAWLRRVLALYSRMDAGSLRFESGSHGKPALVPAQAQHAPAFNLSHSGSAALVAVAAAPVLLGVDIEQHQPLRRFDRLARRHFAATEVQQLACTPAQARERTFYDTWSLKESFIKARGEGLAIPLGDFAFAFDRAGGRIGFTPAASLGEHPSDWRFWSFRVSDGYSAAIALRTPPATPWRAPRLFSGSPLRPWCGLVADTPLASGGPGVFPRTD